MVVAATQEGAAEVSVMKHGEAGSKNTTQETTRLPPPLVDLLPSLSVPELVVLTRPLHDAPPRPQLLCPPSQKNLR
jgi:hypothetical protein